MADLGRKVDVGIPPRKLSFEGYASESIRRLSAEMTALDAAADSHDDDDDALAILQAASSSSDPQKADGEDHEISPTAATAAGRSGGRQEDRPKRFSIRPRRGRNRRASVSDMRNKLANPGASTSHRGGRRESLTARFFGILGGSGGSSRRPRGLGSSILSISSIGSMHIHKEKYTVLQKLVVEMRESLSHFDDDTSSEGDGNAIVLDDAELEGWAILIYESMSAPSRTFHGVSHCYDISHGADPIQKVSAFFHDIIYYSIDGGLSPAQEKVLHGLVEENSDDKAVSVCEGAFDEPTLLVMDIFGFKPGQTLNPFSGLNEFLSAALAVRCLKDTLSLTHLAKIAACIEATIPFRAPDEDGKTCTDHLFERLKEANITYKMGMSQKELVEATQRAADLANRDVANFAVCDRAAFLSNTWNLLPESNISLRHTQSFRIGDFTLALKKMSGFFTFLKPENIYTSFENKPTAEELADMAERARLNIEVSNIYMHCKLLSISVLYALAELTGGDAPIALFLGDLPTSKSISPAIEDYIALLPPAKGVELDMRVFKLLRDGRDGESQFDIKNSPLAAYLYALMGDKDMEEALKLAVYPMTPDDATKLLDAIPPQAVVKIALSCAEICLTRAKKLEQIAAKYEP